MGEQASFKENLQVAAQATSIDNITILDKVPPRWVTAIYTVLSAACCRWGHLVE